MTASGASYHWVSQRNFLKVLYVIKRAVNQISLCVQNIVEIYPNLCYNSPIQDKMILWRLNLSTLIPVEQAIALSGVSGASFRAWWRRDPQAPAKVRHGRRVYYDRQEIERWLADLLPR